MNSFRGFAFRTLAFLAAFGSYSGCSPQGEEVSGPPKTDGGPTDGGGDGGGASCSTGDGVEKIGESKVAVVSMTVGSLYLYWATYDAAAPGYKTQIMKWSTDAKPGDPAAQFTERVEQALDIKYTTDALYLMEKDGSDNKVVRLKHSGGGSTLVVPTKDKPAAFAVNADNVFAALPDGVSTYPLEGGAGTHLKLIVSSSPPPPKELTISDPKAIAVDSSNLAVLSENDGLIMASTSGTGANAVTSSISSLGHVAAMDDTNVYWIEGKKRKKYPVSSGGSPDTLDTSEVQFIAPLSSGIVWSAYDEALGGIVRRAAADATSPTVVILRKAKVGAVAATSSFVYWVEGAADTGYCIMRKPKS